MSLAANIEDDGTAHELVGHDQERRRGVERTLGARTQLFILDLESKEVIQRGLTNTQQSCILSVSKVSES